MQIIGLMGAMGAGKDTTADIIAQLVPGLARVAFADALRAEAERLRADAERYRFLRNDFRAGSADINGQHAWVYGRNFSLRGPSLDAAIDAARAAQGDKT